MLIKPDRTEQKNISSPIPSLHSLSSFNYQAYQSAKSPAKDVIKENQLQDGSHDNFYPICNTERSEELYSCDENELEIKRNNAKKIATNTNDKKYMSSSLKSISENFDDEKDREIFFQVVYTYPFIHIDIR